MPLPTHRLAANQDLFGHGPDVLATDALLHPLLMRTWSPTRDQVRGFTPPVTAQNNRPTRLKPGSKKPNASVPALRAGLVSSAAPSSWSAVPITA